METQDHPKSGHEGHGGTHVCHKCGWPFPKPHPSARHRRAHKKVCGTIEGYKLVNTPDKTHLDGSDGEHVSDDELKTSKGGKVVERTISRKSSSGVGSRSSRSTRSEDDVFADAVTDFVDSPGLEESSHDSVRCESSLQKITEIDSDDTIAEVVIDDISSTPNIDVKDNQVQTVQNLEREKNKMKDGVVSQHCVSSYTSNPTLVSASITEKNENALGQHIKQSSDESSELNLSVEDSQEASSKDFPEDIVTDSEVSGNMPQVVSVLRTVNEELPDSFPADEMVKSAGMQTDGFEDMVECSHVLDSLVNVHALTNSAVVESVDDIDNSASMIKEQESNISAIENMHVVAVPNALSLQDHPEIEVEDLDHKGGKFNISAGPNTALAFEDLESDKDRAIRESSGGTDFTKHGKNNTICVEGVVLKRACSTENVLEQDVEDIIGEADELPDTKVSNTINDEFKSKELSGDIKSETREKEISYSEDKDYFEGAIVDRGENQDNKANILVVVNSVVLDNDCNKLQVDELTATSSALAEYPCVSSHIGDDDKVKVEGTALNANEMIGGDDESKTMSPETAPVYGLTSPECQKGNVEAFEPNIKYNESHKILDSSNMLVGHLQPENLLTSDCVRELQSTDYHLAGEECIEKCSTGGVAKIDDNIDPFLKKTQIGTTEVLEIVESSLPSSAAIGDSCTAAEEIAKNVPSAVEGHGSIEEHVGASAVDTLMDSNSQTDSLEGNWGSVSVLSAISDTTPATDTVVLNNSQASLEAGTVVSEPKDNEMGQDSETNVSLEQNIVASEIQTSKNEQPQCFTLQSGWSPSVGHMANNIHTGKKDEEIIAKVTNWSTEKQHTPLKTLLGEAIARSRAESPDHDNSILVSKKEEIPLTKNGLSATTDNFVFETTDAAKEEIGTDWNSPARYPVNIKTEKRRAKNKSYWAPFLCCSSVSAAR